MKNCCGDQEGNPRERVEPPPIEHTSIQSLFSSSPPGPLLALPHHPSFTTPLPVYQVFRRLPRMIDKGTSGIDAPFINAVGMIDVFCLQSRMTTRAANFTAFESQNWVPLSPPFVPRRCDAQEAESGPPSKAGWGGGGDLLKRAPFIHF